MCPAGRHVTFVATWVSYCGKGMGVASSSGKSKKSRGRISQRQLWVPDGAILSIHLYPEDACDLSECLR
jgi:hypothetical protein